MNIHTQTDIWIQRSMIVLSSIAGITIILAALNQPLPEVLMALGAVAAGGLARLLVPSPLSQR